MKKRLLRLLGKAAQYMSLNRLIQVSGRSFILPVYHLSSDEPAPHIRHIYPIRDTRLFEADLDFFLKYYQPVSLGEVGEMIAQDKPFSGPSFYLSFDDGLREIYDFVAPILKQKGVPATFFINSAFVDNQALFYRYKASLLVDHFMSKNWSEATQKKVFSILDDTDIPGGLMKVTYQNQQVLDDVAAIAGYDFEHFLQMYRPYLTSEQIQSLIEDGFTIGGHSVDHPEYRFIPLAEQLSQTQQSVDALAKKFAMPLRNFAFPFTDFGVGREFFQQIDRNDMVDLSFGCAGIKTDIFPWHLQRLPMEGDLRSAEAIVKTEYLYFLLKKGFGKNYIRRS
jgi:peptidoglycan/xylan/chitin deacetylase (PgdA/CDA1 family)